MQDVVLAAVAALFLFLVIFPLVGLLSGFVARVCTPYLIGPFVAYLFSAQLEFTGQNIAVLLLSLLWIVSILHVRQRLRKIHDDLHWSEGHYYGAFNIVTFATPLRKRKTFINRPTTLKT